MTPAISTHGYAVALTLDLKSDSIGSLGMSTQLPWTSNFQPWYTQRSPLSSLRPKNSDAPRCGQFSATRPTAPSEPRNATNFSPSRLTRTGVQSDDASSEDSTA